MSGVRLHWVSPLAPAETDIAHYTGRILPALAARARVVLWTDASDWAPWLEDHAPVRRYDPAAGLDLGALPGHAGPELAVLQIGNSRAHHSGPLRLARQMPGLVVLHDTGLQDLCLGMIADGTLARGAYRAAMRHWYGGKGASLADRVVARRIAPADATPEMPGFEIAIERAAAVLTHTQAGFDAVAARHRVPAYALDLPFAPGPEPDTARAATGPLRLVQFGYIAPNRRLDQVLEALATLNPAIRFEFDIFGTLWDERHLRGKIADLGLSDRVRLNGYVAEAALDAALARAHLVFNLRHPTMGEASGSQLRIWNAGAAAAVSDAGWYAGLPADTVLRLPLAGEREAIAALVARIDADRDLPARIGAAGRARLLACHRPETYADGIMEIAAGFEADAREALLAEAGRAALARLARREPAVAGLARAIGGGAEG